MGATLAVSPVALAARPTAAGVCWVRSHVPGDALSPGAPSPAGSSFPCCFTPFHPTFPAGTCKPPRTFTHPAKSLARRTQDLGYRHPPAHPPGAPHAGCKSIGRTQEITRHVVLFSPISFFFFPSLFPGAKAVFLLPLLLSSLQPPSIPPAGMLARLAEARLLLCHVNSTERAEQKAKGRSCYRQLF